MMAYDNKLKSCLIEMMEQEEAGLREELRQSEPHVFSETYRRTMNDAMQVQKRKSRQQGILRYVAAAVVTVLLAGGILFIGSEDLRASNVGIDILEWLEDFFTVRDGTDVRKETDVLFEESQIGYLPEGFEKVSETALYSSVAYRYENGETLFINIRVHRSKFEVAVDNEEIDREIKLNEQGLEYTHILKDDFGNETVIWQGEQGFYYMVDGNVGEEELIKIMNHISY